MQGAAFLRLIMVGVIALFSLRGGTALAATPVIEFYRASTTSVETLQAVRLWWKVQNATRVDVYDGFRDTTYPALGNENYIEVWPERTATYTLLAYGSEGQVVRQDIVIQFAPLEIELFQASAQVSTPRQAIRLWWKVRGAARVDVQDSFTSSTYPDLGNDNYIQVYPERTATYTLIAYGQGRSVSRQITVIVERHDPQILQFVASSSVIYDPQPVYLRWSVAEATRVDIEDGFTGQVYNQVGLQGQIQVRPEATATYTLRAHGADGQVVTQQLTITVQTQPPRIDYFRAQHPFILAGQSTILEWRVDPASMVQITDDQGHLLYRGRTFMQSIPVTPTHSTTYFLRAYWGFRGDFVESSARVDVASP